MACVAWFESRVELSVVCAVSAQDCRGSRVPGLRGGSVAGGREGQRWIRAGCARGSSVKQGRHAQGAAAEARTVAVFAVVMASCRTCMVQCRGCNQLC